MSFVILLVRASTMRALALIRPTVRARLRVKGHRPKIALQPEEEIEDGEQVGMRPEHGNIIRVEELQVSIIAHLLISGFFSDLNITNNYI